MLKQSAAALAIASLSVLALDAQTKKGPKPITYDVIVTAEATDYTGTMDLTVNAGTVTGTMKITSPSEINGTVAGTSKAGKMKLDFPYHHVAEGCEGRVEVDLTLPEKAGAPITGTVSITGCGRSDDDKLPGTISLTPQAAAKKPA